MLQRPETTFVFNPADPTYLATTKVGLDLLGPLPPAQGNWKYVVVAVEYFSKWIQAKPLSTITSSTVYNFFGKILFVASVCRGLSPLITELNSMLKHSKTFVTRLVQKYTLHQ
jgi:hypothetical protein